MFRNIALLTHFLRQRFFFLSIWKELPGDKNLRSAPSNFLFPVSNFYIILAQRAFLNLFSQTSNLVSPTSYFLSWPIFFVFFVGRNPSDMSQSFRHKVLLLGAPRRRVRSSGSSDSGRWQFGFSLVTRLKYDNKNERTRLSVCLYFKFVPIACYISENTASRRGEGRKKKQNECQLLNRVEAIPVSIFGFSVNGYIHHNCYFYYFLLIRLLIFFVRSILYTIAVGWSPLLLTKELCDWSRMMPAIRGFSVSSSLARSCASAEIQNFRFLVVDRLIII